MSKDEAFKDAELSIKDQLQLELRKEEKTIKPPMAMYKIVLILVAVLVIASGLCVGVAKLIHNNSTDPNRDFVYWLNVMFLIAGGTAIFFGGVLGVWGGQRRIPIRMVSPIDSSVIGKGLFVTGYAIEDCLDDEIELTVYGKDKDNIIYEEMVRVLEGGLFYTKLAEDVFEDEKKSKHLTFETWMVSTKTKQFRFVVREKKFEHMNIFRKGLKIGKAIFFPIVFKDFTDKAKTIYDPKRKEKGIIENVKINEQKTTNIFYPSKQAEDGYIPFSYERIAEMRQNAIYFDIKRRRRLLNSLAIFGIAILFFLFPVISIFI